MKDLQAQLAMLLACQITGDSIVRTAPGATAILFKHSGRVLSEAVHSPFAARTIPSKPNSVLSPLNMILNNVTSLPSICTLRLQFQPMVCMQ